MFTTDPNGCSGIEQHTAEDEPVNPNPVLLKHIKRLQYQKLHRYFYFFCSYLPRNTMSFVLFWRCIVFSEKCSPRLPLTVRLHSPLFTFPLFSLLSSSSSPHVTTPSNVISDLLTKECGFSSSQVTTFMSKRPKMLRAKSDDTAREAIHFLKDCGITGNKLKSTLLNNPIILSLRADRQLKPKMEFLKKLGLPTQDVTFIISRLGRLFHLNLENCLAPRVLHLETLFGSRFHLCKALRRAPQLLMSDFEKQVIPRVEYLKKFGIIKGSVTFERVLNEAVTLTLGHLEKKTIHMTSLGLAEVEIRQILKRDPKVLRLSIKKITANFDFLVSTAGLEPKIVALDPTLLGLSVEKRLKPRYEVFKSLRTSAHIKGLPSLARFFRLSEQEFLRRFGQYNYHTISEIEDFRSVAGVSK